MKNDIFLKSNLLFYVLFIVIILIGINIHDNYGVTWDEFRHRDYALEVQKTWGDTPYDEVVGDGESHAATKGVSYLIPLNIIERAFSPKNEYEIFKVRRLLNHLFYVLTGFLLFVFLNLIKRSSISILCSLAMYFLMPRIYVHSFYNPVDIPLFCFFIMGLISLFFFLRKVNLLNCAIHAFVCGMCFSIRTVGEVFIFATLLAFVLKNYQDMFFNKRNIKYMVVFIFLSLLFAFALTPFLWTKPFESLLKLHNYSFYYKPVIQRIVYWGEVYKSIKLPWHYTFSWIFLTIPIGFLLLIIGAVTKSLVSLLKDTLFIDPFLLSLVFILASVLGAASFFDYSKYNDWRHFYFLYAVMIFLVSFSLDFIFNSKIKNIIFPLIVFQIFITSFDMYKLHPYQLVYFNGTIGGTSGAKDLFPMDYFGSSFKQSLDIITNLNKKKVLKVRFIPYFPGLHNYMALPEEVKDRIKVVRKTEEADIISTKWVFKPYDNYENLRYSKLLEIKTDNTTIHKIFIK